MPTVFLEFPLATLFIIVVAALLFISIFSPKRPQGQATRGPLTDANGTRHCRACGTDHPAFAVYCKRCGRRL